VEQSLQRRLPEANFFKQLLGLPGLTNDASEAVTLPASRIRKTSQKTDFWVAQSLQFRRLGVYFDNALQR
jgi:hypothetical protein